MLINLLTATAQNTKPTLIKIVVKIALYRPSPETISVRSPEIEYCLIVNKAHKLLKFNTSIVKLSAQSSVIKTIENRVATEREHRELHLEQPYKEHFETYDCVATKNALKSSDSLLNLAKANYENKIIETLIARLNRPSLIQKEIIQNLDNDSKTFTINIVSSFEISPEKKVDLTAIIQKRISEKAKLKFTIKRNFKSLIELDTESFKIYWNLQHYLIEVKSTQYQAQ